MMRWLKRITLTLLAIILLLAAGIGIVLYKSASHRRQLTESWIFKENQVGPVIGDLGGIPVSIPHHYLARFMEYEGDPHFLEPRKGAVPIRSFQSSLRSFGFEVRFPDMAPLTEATPEEKHKTTIFNTMWLNVGVDVAPYNNELSLQRLVAAITSRKWDAIHTKDTPPEIWKNKHGYKTLPDPLYGLIVNEVYGYDDAKRYHFPGVDMGDKNIYHHVDDHGKVDTYIKCHNVKHSAAQCEQKFILIPAKNTMVSVSYRIGLLPQWREIQAAVTKVILGFAIDLKRSKPLKILETERKRSE
jgi:hypothetical protein